MRDPQRLNEDLKQHARLVGNLEGKVQYIGEEYRRITEEQVKIQIASKELKGELAATSQHFEGGLQTLVTGLQAQGGQLDDLKEAVETSASTVSTLATGLQAQKEAHEGELGEMREAVEAAAAGLQSSIRDVSTKLKGVEESYSRQLTDYRELRREFSDKIHSLEQKGEADLAKLRGDVVSKK